MTRKSVYRALIVLLIAAFVLHNDFWLWDDASTVRGFPLNLLYHVGLCGVASLIFAGLLRAKGGPGADSVGESGS